jgi:hypothetical protein
MILYCAETPNLKLGPGTKAGDPDVIVFEDGYAEVSPDDPLFKAKMSWLVHPGTPYIRILDDNEIPNTTADAVFCPECGKPFATDKQLNGHLMSHRRER